MATPLTALTKYTGVMMVVLCALLMFAFVIGDPLMQYAGGAGGPGGGSFGQEVAATWRGGSINKRLLGDAVRHRNLLWTFQQAVFEAGTLDAREDGVEDLGLRVRPLTLPRTYEEGVERSVVQTKIFAQRAAEAGMVVSDEMVNDYLRAIGRDRVSSDEMRAIISNLRMDSGRKATIAFLFDLLREAILANNYLSSHTYAAETVLPAERWADWKKANERVVVEAAPLATEAFVSEVGEPSDDELQAFYEQYRERVPSPDILRGYGDVQLPSPSPAFAVPPRVKLAVLKADFNVAVANVEDEITDEQIAAFYEANKESFIEADRALFGDDTLTADDTPAEDAEPSDDGLEADTTAEDPAAEAEGEAPGTEETDLAEDAAGETATENTPADQATDDPASTEEEEEEEETPDADSDASDEAAEETGGPYQPLEMVAEEIRTRLATERAAQVLQDQMQRIKSGLDNAFEDYSDDLFAADSDEAAEAITPPEALADLKPLAEAEQLELLEVDEASQFELSESPIGLSRNADPSSGGLPVWFVAFREKQLDRYRPLVTFDREGNRYLLMVTKRYEGETPELDVIRDQVVAAWKQAEAAKLALERGKELAAKAAESGGPLVDFLTDTEGAPIDPEAVVETDAFSLLTIGQIAPNAREVPLRLSQPQPLAAPGPELLEAVFELSDGEVAAELNHDHSLVYLMRVAQRIGTPAELRREFLRDGDRWFGLPVLMRSRFQRVYTALVIDLLEEADLVWAIDPDQAS